MYWVSQERRDSGLVAQLQLIAALAGAALVGRRDWRAAFAAGIALRLLLDPAGLGYYDAGLIMVTALTERFVGGRPWRTAALCLTVAYLPSVPATASAVVRFVGLAVLVSQLVAACGAELPVLRISHRFLTSRSPS